ncbi:MAG: hypothetical protein K1000chlam1_01245 [Candidatus Anoxychlamydiales bacterium]|nr:hypothetical protein [Candidatus Anoxychlamydiales bacterium]
MKKKILLIISLLVSTLAFAENTTNPSQFREEIPIKGRLERENFSYVAIGGIVPNLTFGYRTTAIPKHQLDISGGFSTIIVGHSFDVTLKGLIRYTDGLYVGGGVKGETTLTKYLKFKRVNSIFTHGWDTSKDFKEISVSFPFSKIKGDPYVYRINIKYGWKI